MKITYDYIMVDTYLPIEFTHRINLHPSRLNKKLNDSIKSVIQKELNNTCLPAHGHIKAGTVQIVSKTLGRIEGSHLTGNITYDVKVRCLATKPIKDTKMVCTVIGKNEAGIMARNFSIPFIFFINRPRDGGDSSIIDTLQLDSTIEVIVRDYKLVAPNKDRTMPEYIIIADISAINVDNGRLTGLQHIAHMNTIDWAVATIGSDAVIDGNTSLTNKWYDRLMDAKKLIAQINNDYNSRLSSTDGKDYLLDTKLAALMARGHKPFVVGEIVDSRGDEFMAIHDFNVIRTFPEMDQYEKGKTYEYRIKTEYAVYPGDIVIYTIDSRDKKSVFAYDFWSNHVRAIINEYELIHPSVDYINQIKAIEPDFNQHFDNKISRAYYKMWEIIRNSAFNKQLVTQNQLRILNLAESPGGFVQAIIDFRKQFNIADDITAISISPNDGTSAWPSSYEKSLVGYVSSLINVSITNNKGVYTEVSKGHTGTLHLMDGDLYDEPTRTKLFKGNDHHNGYEAEADKADFISGDGGVHSERDEDQELINQKLLFSQAVMAMMCQKEGGTFVLKCFDIAHEFTANIVAILCAMYTDVNIYKPKGSRPANSEKYLICHGYKPNSEILDKCVAILNDWTHTNIIDRLFTIPGDLRMSLQHFNNLYMEKQVAFIESGLEYSKTYMQNMGNTEVMASKVSIQKARRATFF